MRGRTWLLVITAWAALLGAGCTSNQPAMVPVKGKVISGGKGVPGVRVNFWPRDPKVRHIEAFCDAFGDFTLECPSGSYTVTVAPSTGNDPALGQGGMPTGPPPSTPPTDKQKSPLVPARFQERQKSPLTLDIPPEGKGDVVLDITK
jgi:hypothetical protein